MRIAKWKEIRPGLWELPATGAMRVPGRLYADRELLEGMDEQVALQIRNVATLPGIVGASYAMPDAHWGYGFPIGGVAAFDPEAGGVVSAGGVGFDISCGVRLLRVKTPPARIEDRIESLAEGLYRRVPAGVGREGDVRLRKGELDAVLRDGACWAVERGYGSASDLERIEEAGRMPGARPEAVSDIAKERMNGEVGTLGSGNHYCEVQRVDRVYDAALAEHLGLAEGAVVVSIHCGSRALGHQVATDYAKRFLKALHQSGTPIGDRELAYAPIRSAEGEAYLGAMRAAINIALANRQVISHLVREVFLELFPNDPPPPLVYDISHNTCKVERHRCGGRERELHVHRKGATRALPPGHPSLPACLSKVGQPVFIGGTMGTASHVLVGRDQGAEGPFASACHGAGRVMSRRQAARTWRAGAIVSELGQRGIVIKGRSKRGLAEEAPGAYKDVDRVVQVAESCGLAQRVARLVPMACVKG